MFEKLIAIAERIAVSLETLVALAQATEAPEKKKKKTEAVAAVATGIEDMLGDAAPKITLDQVKDALRAHMRKNGAEVTKALMIKHGANAAKPVVTSIPEANYAALMKELG